MKLFYTQTSPYARKVRMVAAMLGIADRITLVETDPRGDLWLRAHNPISKIPTLQLENGDCLFDSPVICEYLAALVPTQQLFPENGSRRWEALTLAALGDAIADSTVIMMLEHRRDAEHQSQAVLARQTLAINASLAYAETRVSVDRVSIGDLAVAAALYYLDFRFPSWGWQDQYPKLFQWLNRFNSQFPICAEL